MQESNSTVKKAGPVRRLFALPNEHPVKTIVVALILCLICSVLVSTAAILLKPRQLANEELLGKQREILRAVGRYQAGMNIQAEFSNIETRLVELATGEYVSHINADHYHYARAVADPATRVEIAPEADIARVRAIAKYAPVYLVQEAGETRLIVLPVHGYGLWSTMYAYLAIEVDGRVAGISFYKQGETPGLGSEIANPRWQAAWRGKRIYDDQGTVRLALITAGKRDPDQAEFQIDALSGATITSKGVTHLIRFWLGEQGYGPYLRRHFHVGGGQ
ncbi:MAG: Na(+)-translocating NADH-quinone reductase subunit C [Gammaproteobacteria bacterium]|nr:Na(+)-translocating NADH-quinone reductase subunit C [Gammaproteobacteria bacterium]MDH5650509.1 Na(+)-translocating NADH-quinone reductase subunit C [Gammaproteobacteria bacterium]